MFKSYLIPFALAVLTCCQTKPSSDHKVVEINQSKIENLDDPALSTDSLIENKLRKQLQEYLIAFNGENADLAIDYCHPDMFLWMEENYPEYESVNHAKSAIKKVVREFKRQAKKNRISYHFQIGEITKRITTEDNELICLIVVSVITEKDFDKMEMGDEVIAFSKDHGESWKFLQKDKETSQLVLSRNYSRSIIERIMN